MNRPHKYISILSILLLVVLGLLENDIFIKPEAVFWKPDKQIGWDNFRGYPNYLSYYGAVIRSYFNYDILNESGDSVRIQTLMEPNHSWTKEIMSRSGYGLRHEQYHFNLSEAVCREFRKSLVQLKNCNINKKIIKSYYYRYINMLNNIQNRYDEQTDHSLILERQKDWEYIIDSMLNEYSYYESPLIKLHNTNNDKYFYFRNVQLNAHEQLIGRYPMDSAVAVHTRYYKFYYAGNKVIKIEFWNRNKLSVDDDIKVAVIKLRYQNDLEFKDYYDAAGNQMKNKFGAYTTCVDRKIKIIIITNLDKSGQVCEDNNGISKIIWDLDAKNRLQAGRFYNMQDQQICDNEGFINIKFKYDERDNIIEKANYNADDKLSNFKNEVAYYRYNYDEQNNITVIYSFNEKHRLSANSGNIAIMHYHYDLYGNVIRQNFKKPDETPFIDEDGIAISYCRYDQYSNMISERHYGLNRNLIIFKDGTGRVERKFDSLGNMIEMQNFDAYDKLLNNKKNVCMVKYKYRSGQIVEEQNYTVDSAKIPSFLKIIRYQYDSNNNVICKKYFDEDDTPLPDSNNICEVRYNYDTRKNLLSVKYYNKSGQMQPDMDGISMYKFKYDERNNRIEVSFYNESGNLKGNKDKIALERYLYNASNKMVEIRYYNSENTLTKNENGVEVAKWEYDLKGDLLKQSCYNKYGKYTPNKNGVAVHQYFYDDRQNNIEIDFYNTEEVLVKDENWGIAKIKYEYSNEKLLTKTSYYDYNDKLVDLPEGFAIQENSYDIYGNIIRQEYYSKSEKPVVTTYGYAVLDWIYDKNNNAVAKILRDGHMALIEDNSGNAIYNWIHDRNGKVIESYGLKADPKNLAKIDYGPFGKSSTGNFLNNNSYTAYNENTRLYTTYYKNGQKSCEVMYVNGKPEGIYTAWYETGEIEYTIEYHDGMKNGKMYEYYKNGQMSREIEYNYNTYIEGTEITWYENGNIRSKYVNGKFVEWDKSGNITSD